MDLRESLRARRGDRTARCQSNYVGRHPDTGLDWQWQCVRLHGHDGACDIRPLTPNVPTPEIAQVLGGTL